MWDIEWLAIPTITVQEQEAPEPTFTGLLDSQGRKLYRHHRPRPIGFVIHEASPEPEYDNERP